MLLQNSGRSASGFPVDAKAAMGLLDGLRTGNLLDAAWIELHETLSDRVECAERVEDYPPQVQVHPHPNRITGNQDLHRTVHLLLSTVHLFLRPSCSHRWVLKAATALSWMHVRIVAAASLMH